MSEPNASVSVDLAHQRYMTLVKLAGLAFFVSLVVGGIGGYLVYQMVPAGTKLFVTLIPGLLCVVATCLPIRRMKNRWFDSPEAIMAASKREPYPAQAAETITEKEAA